jgi:putative addiction module component (TIGR02574 family)
MTDLRQLCSLPVAERLELVEDLWDSIAEEPGELRLTASHIAELDRRIDRFEESPDTGTDWNRLKGRIQESL